MLDIDNFKLVNDVYGHNTGDDVLKEVSNIINNSIREKDKAFRYGGEEFIIIFDEINYSKLSAPLERIREKVEKIQIIPNKNITISIGAASLLEDNPCSVEEFVNFSDIAMYHAKKTGKNKVVFYKDIK